MLLSSVVLMLSAWSGPSSQSPANIPRGVDPGRPLSFSKSGKFHISIFEDLHFAEDAKKDAKTIKVIEGVLKSEAPDFVVLNGDLIAGEYTRLESSTSYIDQIVGPLLARGLPWASTYGNHDHNFNLSGAMILAREKKWPNARTQSMVSGRNAGVSNYYLPVYSASDTNPRDTTTPELLLWFFDSRGGFYTGERNRDGSQVSQPDWVDASVADWFDKTNAQLTKRFGKVIPSLAFVHIPTNASVALQTERCRESVHPNRQPGINDDFPLLHQAVGQDVPFMKAVVNTPGLIGLFSAHDHGTTWCYKWDHRVHGMTVAGNGVNLCFGQHSGYGGYGNWIRGGRQILLSSDTLRRRKWEAKTWIRLETGFVVGSVNLNATYGKDMYPATRNDKT